MMLLVKAFTIFLFAIITKESGAAIESVATTFEGNAIFRIGMSLGMIGYILTVIIIPASAMSFYYYMRRKVMKGKVDIDSLGFFVQFTFFALLINIVNDGSALCGKIWSVLQ